MSRSYQSIKGFADLFHLESHVFTRIEEIARKHFGLYGYEELRTPIAEYTELFVRGIGTETDVVQKEMYTFPDKKGRSLTLRPEATAGVIRAFIQKDRHEEGVHKFFTHGPMFRYERPQKGRLRQFHQINCECLGGTEPAVDAEMICMVSRFIEELGISETKMHINSLGCKKCRPEYNKILQIWLQNLDAKELCTDCIRRKDNNPLRVLDCKVPSCKKLTANAPKLSDHICSECKSHFAEVCRLLEAENVAYFHDVRLVRGLDYYCRTTFECISDAIGAQGTVAGGGRYDGLVAQLGGDNVAGIGFACGMERLAMLMPKKEAGEELHRPDFFIALLEGKDEKAKTAAFTLCQALRQKGLSGTMNFTARSTKSLMRQAGKLQARFVVLLGEDEIATQKGTVKNMDAREQESLSFEAIADYIASKL